MTSMFLPNELPRIIFCVTLQQLTGDSLDIGSLGFDCVDDFLRSVVWWTVRKRTNQNGEVVYCLDVKPNAAFLIQKERYASGEFFTGDDANIPTEPFPEGKKRRS